MGSVRFSVTVVVVVATEDMGTVTVGLVGFFSIERNSAEDEDILAFEEEGTEEGLPVAAEAKLPE